MSDVIYAGMTLSIFFFIAVNFIFQALSADVAEDYLDVISCPMPLFQGYPNTNSTYNTASSSDSTLLLDCSSVHTPNGTDYFYGQPAVAIGVFFFIMDYISRAVEIIVNVILLLILPLSLPAVIGSLSFMWAINMPAYLFIGLGIKKAVTID